MIVDQLGCVHAEQPSPSYEELLALVVGLAWGLERVQAWIAELLPAAAAACGSCGKITTAAAPWGAAGNVAYGPNVNAAAILLASEGNVHLERTAMLTEALLGTPVSTGFVACAWSALPNAWVRPGSMRR